MTYGAFILNQNTSEKTIMIIAMVINFFTLTLFALLYQTFQTSENKQTHYYCHNMSLWRLSLFSLIFSYINLMSGLLYTITDNIKIISFCMLVTLLNVIFCVVSYIIQLKQDKDDTCDFVTIVYSCSYAFNIIFFMLIQMWHFKYNVHMLYSRREYTGIDGIVIEHHTPFDSGGPVVSPTILAQ